MTTQEMVKDNTPRGNTVLYRYKETLADGATSKAVLIPEQGINGISVYNENDADIYLTNSSLVDIEADEAVWILYDNVGEINTAITAFYVDNNTGDNNKVELVVRTDGLLG